MSNLYNNALSREKSKHHNTHAGPTALKWNQHHHHNQEKDSNDERIYDPAWIRTDPRKKDNFERL